MKEIKDTVRSRVRIGFDGRVYKTFRGTDRDKRYAQEKRVLNFLEEVGCDFVPRVLDFDDDELVLVTTSCGQPVDVLGETKQKELFDSLEAFGVKHDDPFMRNITYDPKRGRFCVIDFELAEIIDAVAAKLPLKNKSEEVVTPRELRWRGATDPGKYKKVNEDTLHAFSIGAAGLTILGEQGEMEASATEEAVFLISDGMGGAARGDMASKMVARRIQELIYKRESEGLNDATLLEFVRECVMVVHDNVDFAQRSDPSMEGMGATLSMLYFVRGRVVIAHVGDSRIYRFRSGQLTQLTEDDSRIWKMLKSGKLNERQYREHPRRNMLTQAIGAGVQFLTPQVSIEQIHPGDAYLICCDGVIDGLWDKHLLEGFRNATEPSTLASAFVRESVKVHGRDNVTALVVSVGR